MPEPVISVGYQGLHLPEFVAMLRTYSVKRLIDVRALPLSRRKGFSKTPLRVALEQAGIAYVHYRDAGNPFRHAASDLHACLEAYETHLDEHPSVVNGLLTLLALPGRAAVLCVERDHHSCHRSRLLEAAQRQRRFRILRAR